MVGLLNWVAPCTLTSADMDLQANMASWILGANPNNLVLLLMPQFCYKKGQLWIADGLVHKLLGSRPLNMDKKFALQFKERPDSRDTRPLLYDGRCLVPVGTKDSDYLFRDCAILKGHVTQASMLRGSSMVQIEDCGDTALPPSTDLDNVVTGAAKYQQVGKDAWEKIMEATTDQLNLPGRAALIFVEMNFIVGDAFDAFVSRRMAMNTPAFYFSAVGDAREAEWFEATKRQMLKDMVLAGTLKVPGSAEVRAECPQEYLESEPEPPSLNRLAIVETGEAEKKEKRLVLPQELLQTWQNHNEFGSQFQVFRDKFFEEFGVA